MPVNQPSDIPMDLQLVARYLAGEASPEEAMALDRWREADAANEREFARLAAVWEAALPEAAYQLPGDEPALEKLAAGLGKAAALPGVKKTVAGRRILWLAAAALLVVALAVALGYLARRPSGTAFTAQPTLAGAPGETSRDTLVDGTRVVLAPGSRLWVGKRFARGSRTVKLDGRAYFEVFPAPGEPFTIRAGDIDIVVLGTRFNVDNDTAEIMVGVREGRVSLRDGNAAMEVGAGSTGVYLKQGQRLRLYKDSLDRNALSYATHELYLYNMSLGAVKTLLEDAYQVKVVFENPALERCRINTKFEHQPLSYVLEVISASLGIQYRVAGKTVYFSGDVYE